MKNKREEIRRVDGYPLYFVSSTGKVFSNRKGKMKQLVPLRGGGSTFEKHLYVNLGCALRIGVHQLVALMFIEKPDSDERLVVRHIDGNPTNNNVENLAWGTQGENLNDRYRHGTMTNGTRNGQAKLTVEDVLEIRKRRCSKETCDSIARDFSISKSQVHRIGLGQRWKHIDGVVAPRVRRSNVRAPM